MSPYQPQILRSLLTGYRHLHSTSALSAYDKQLLSKLRKKTGFTLINCKKALELHENDFDKAEEWIRKEAQTAGWEKASKLESRATPQGLVGIWVRKNFGTIVEVNCETDFVARTENFRMLMEEVLKCLSDVRNLNSDSIIKEHLSREQLQSMPTQEGKTLGDLVALTVSMLSENILLSRATRLYVPPEVELQGYAHPSTLEKPSLMGRCAAIVVLQNPPNDPELLRELCTHIVGKNPTSIGSLEEDEKLEEGEEETRLVHQTLITDEEFTVGEILTENNMQILDFVRYQCGETISNVN